jgi:hypothetical protein
VHVAVVQAGDDGVAGGIDHLGAVGGRPGIGVHGRDRADGDDRVPVHEHGAGVENGGPVRHGQDDAVADQDVGHAAQGKDPGGALSTRR